MTDFKRLPSILLFVVIASFSSASPLVAQGSNRLGSDTTLAEYLATNTATYASGRNGDYADMLEIRAPDSRSLDRLTNAAWSQSFWLKDVHGLCATAIGYTNVTGGQGLITMVSPRHYLFATHMHPESYTVAFLDTNNIVYFRKTLQRINVAYDTSVGLLDQDLPPSVGFLPVLPSNYTNYLPSPYLIQGIGMNQDMCLFGEPMTIVPYGINWNSALSVPRGLTRNWNVTIRGGDSSNPALLLIDNQLILVSHNYFVGGGPNYATQIPAINRTMHLLSVTNHLDTDYRLTEFPLDRWPVIQ